jgi:hypothetical protein
MVIPRVVNLLEATQARTRGKKAAAGGDGRW